MNTATAKYSFPGVTLLITHYNRTGSLERLLASFRELGCSFEEIVVSDDGSRPEHQEKLQLLEGEYGYRLVTGPVNMGLGHNLNKGQEAVRTPLTLYVQEDFVPLPAFPGRLAEALRMMEARPELDIVRFYAYFRYPYLRSVGQGVSEMRFRLWLPGYLKFYMYSDHPHLRRSNFLQRFGRYTEGVKGDVTEYRMMMSFLQQRGRGLFYEDYKGLFDQRNSAAEPSTMKRNFWRESDNPLVTGMRHLYRHLRFNFDFLFRRFKNY
jgi:glycosyltransferase involved in cell wall biosynthesis